MSNKPLAKLAMFAIVAMLASAASAQPGGQARITEKPWEFQVNQVRTLNNVTRVVVGDTSTVEVTPLSDGSGVILTAKAPGTTELEYVLLDEPSIIRSREITVRARDIEAVRGEIETLLSYMVGLQVEKSGNESLVIKGKVLERSDRDHLTRVLEAYPTAEDLKIFDFTEDEFLDTEERRLQNQVEADLLEEKLTTIKVEVKNVRGSFKALLRGVAYTDRARDRAQEIASLYYGDVINLVQLEKPVIELDVVIAELDLNKTKQLGTNDAFAAATSFTLSGYLNSNFGRDSFFKADADNRGQVANEQRPDEPGISTAPTISISPGGVSTFIRALSQTGAAIVYVEQHQAVLSGESATFTDGRELNIPIEGGGGAAGGFFTVTTGVNIEVTPEQKEDGTIRNQVRVENSTLTDLINTSAGLATDVDTFETETVVECRSDETIVLGGADTHRLTHGDTGTPVLRRIPIVNLLFRARDKDGTEARSLILITPTSSTIRRESRQAFSIDSFRKRDFIQDQSPYWERHIDWGHYEEFYEKAKTPILFLNSWEQSLYYEEIQDSDATSYDTGGDLDGAYDDGFGDGGFDDGMGTMDDGMGAMDDGMGAMDDGMGAMDDGMGAMDDGMGTMDDGMGGFEEDGSMMNDGSGDGDMTFGDEF